MAKGFGVSPITNTIYYGTQDPVKHMWTGKKEDVTDEVVAAVFEWFIGYMEGNEEHTVEEHCITYPSTEYELVMRRKKAKKIDDSTESNKHNSYNFTSPCPYCGTTEYLDTATLGDKHKVICNLARGGCGANIPWQDTKEEAIDYWNKYLDDSDEE